MRKGLTLIELIFSMVIIAIVFTVVPKIIFVSNKTLELSVKEDGIYEAISLLGSISRLPWDENTLLSNGKILHTDDNNCNDTSGYRVGGFIGSRNCIDSSESKSTILGQENGSDDYNDIDDYNGEDDYDENSSSGKDYNLSTTVEYDANNDNIKKVVVTVKGGAKTGNFQTSVFYESANLGYIKINKRAW
jgi:prepilin-type N-terminal cleavage/methylation domain-containing protein